MTTLGALKLCGFYGIYAFLAAGIYDLGHSWLLWRKSRRLGHFLGDIMILSVLGAGFARLMVGLGGIFRWYVPAAVILGAILYYLTLGRFLRRVYGPIFDAIAFLWHKLTFPWRKAAALIKKCYKKFQKKFKKLSQSTGIFSPDDV